MIFDVYSCAKQLDGRCTWDFSQGFPFFNIRNIAVENTKSRGSCLALSAEWIFRQLNDDALANHLGGIMRGRTWIQFNQKELVRICNQQTAYCNSIDWERLFHNWITFHSLKVLDNYKGKANQPEIRQGLVKLADACGLVTIYSSNTKVSASHAIAVYAGSRGGQAAVFDPNYGEFWFDDRENGFFFFHLLCSQHYKMKHKFDRWKLKRIWTL